MPIRPFKLPADIDTLLAIIEPAFQYPENEAWSLQTDEMESMAETLNSVRRLWPLMRGLQLFVPSLRDLLAGFVWEEDGQAVGLANVDRRGTSRRWIIGNVAVLPAYRQRGIARALVQACIDLARARDAQQIVLDVVAGNDPAYTLYERLGFTPYSGSAMLDFEGEAVRGPLRLPRGYHAAKITPFDWQPRFALAQRIQPEAVSRYEPVDESTFKIPPPLRLLFPLLNRLSGQRAERIVVRDSGGQVVAAAAYHGRTRSGGTNDLSITLDPACPELAAPLVNALLGQVLHLAPGRRVEFEVPAWQPALIDAATAVGFTCRCEFRRMGLLLENA